MRRIILLVLLCGCLYGVPVLAQDGNGGAAIVLSGTGIASVVGLVLSLALAYVPGFKAWWDNFSEKQTALAAVGFLGAWAMVALHYLGAFDLGLGAFGWTVVFRVFESWFAFAGAGQIAFTGERLVRRGRSNL